MIKSANIVYSNFKWINDMIFLISERIFYEIAVRYIFTSASIVCIFILRFRHIWLSIERSKWSWNFIRWSRSVVVSTYFCLISRRRYPVSVDAVTSVNALSRGYDRVRNSRSQPNFSISGDVPSSLNWVHGSRLLVSELFSPFTGQAASEFGPDSTVFAEWMLYPASEFRSATLLWDSVQSCVAKIIVFSIFGSSRSLIRCRPAWACQPWRSVP